MLVPTAGRPAIIMDDDDESSSRAATRRRNSPRIKNNKQ